MMRYLKLYRRILSLSLMRVMAYPEDFLTWAVVDTIWAIINIGFFRILLFAIPEIAGWTFEMLAIPLGIFYFLNAVIWGLLWTNMDMIPKDINRGNLDMFLTKPINSQFILSTRFIGINLFPSIIAGGFLLWYGFTRNHLNPALVVIVPVALISSSLIAYSVWFMTVTLALWFNRLLAISHVFPTAADVSRYPVTIFHPAIRFLFTYIIPLAMLGFLPAEVILGRISPLNLLLPMVMAAILVYLSHLFWNFSLKRYSSASS